MSSNIGKKNIAFKGSGHGAVSPPAMSLVNPPAPPAPMGFPYKCSSDTAANTAPKYRKDSYEIMIEGSTMDLDSPANQPSQTGDILTHAVTKIAVMTMGSMIMHVCGKGVCATGDIVAMNVFNKGQRIAQMFAPLLEKADYEAAQASNAAAAEMNKKYLAAFPPPAALQTKAGDPVDLGTGFVVDEAIDLTLPGLIPLVWRRTYSSALHKERTALGKGGWLHGFEAWVEPTASGVRFHDEEGIPVDFPAPAPDGKSFHRGRRLELSAAGGGYEIRGLSDRLTRVFLPLPGGRLALRAVRDAYQHKIQLEYEGELLVRVRDTVGRELRIANDSKGRVTRVEVWAAAPGSGEPPSLQAWFDYAYHPEGELASHTNALGHTKSWEYDGLHRMVKTTTRNGIAFYYEYDEDLGRCVRTWGDGGLHDVRLEIDPANGETRTHGTSRARRYLWKNGLVLREETFDGEWAEAREYDADELVVSRANAAGEAFVNEHDARGNLVKVTDPAGNVTIREYAGDLPALRIGPTGLETRYHHDHRGALSAIDSSRGVTFHFERDRDGKLTAIHGPAGEIVRLAYDEHKNVASEASARGKTTHYRYDALGRPIERTCPLGRVTRLRYDGVGQMLEVRRPDGTTLVRGYDRVGNLTRETDALGRTTRFEHSGTGHLAKITQPDGQVYAFLHDSDERLVEIINPRLERYRLEYDRADRVVSERTFDDRLLGYRYSRAGRVVRFDYPDEEWRELTYDKLGNVLEDRGADVQITFVRDALGRVEQAACQDVMGKAVTVFERDRFGRTIAEIHNGRAVRSEYDPLDRRVARVAPNGERTEYRYDEDDEFVGVIHEGRAISILRDEVGRERVREGKAWRLETDYDARDRVVSQRVIATAAQLTKVAAQRRYAYDAGGRLTSIESAHAGLTTYGYDQADQLVESSARGLREVFEYDPAGSLVDALRGLEERGGRPVWSLGPGNRLRATNQAKYVNDGRGRRIQRVTRPDGKDPREHPPTGEEATTIYGWDTKGRLREVVLPEGTRVRFMYDAFGRRVRKDVLPRVADLPARLAAGDGAPAPRTVAFVWDGDVLCEERSSEGADVRRERVHVHEPDGFTPMLQSEGGKVFAVIVDHLGTPKELIDERGGVAWRARHGAWGDLIQVERDPATAEVESPFRLLGQYADEETGLAYARFRYFDPACGRWLSPDPLEVVGGLNLSGFDGAPTLVGDPLGLGPPWAPHPPTQNDVIGKGLHFNTDVRGLELSVRSEDGNTIWFQRWPKPNDVNDPLTGDAQRQADTAREMLKNDKWRARLLAFAEDAIDQLRNTHKMEHLAKAMERVRDALKKAGANKGGQT